MLKKLIQLGSTLFLTLIATASGATDITVSGPSEVPPYMPGFRNPAAPHVGIPITITVTNPPPNSSGIVAGAYIRNLEARYQNAGYPTVPPTDNGGHVDHDERRRFGVHLSTQQNDFPGPFSPRYIGINMSLTAGDNIFYFYPPEMSGSYKLYITGGDSHYLEADAIVYEINIKVPNLVELTAAPGSWRLIGEKPKHPSNHFATQTAITLLNNLRSQWLQISPNAPEWEVNDESLKWGGIFDINKAGLTEWTRPHADHRDGKALDIGHGTIPMTDRNRLYHFFRGDPINIGGTSPTIIRFTGPIPRLVLYGPPDHTTHYHVEEF